MAERYEEQYRPVTPRAQRYWGGLIGSGMIAVAISLLLLPLSLQAGENLGSGKGSIVDPFLAPISPAIAALIVMSWLGGLIAMCLVFYSSLDEVEERNYSWAGLMGWYAMILAIPAWHVLWMGRLAPPVGVWWIFALGLLTNLAVWMWRQYRTR